MVRRTDWKEINTARKNLIKYQCAIMNNKKPDLKDLKKFGICLDRLEYGGMEK